MNQKQSLFHPYKSLGLVCDGNFTGCRPTSLQQGLSYFLITPVDGARVLHLYDIYLNLKGVSKPIPLSWSPSSRSRTISHIAAYELLTFAVIEDVIGVFHSLAPFTAWKRHDANIICVKVISNILVSVDSESNLIAWKLPSSAKDMPSRDGHVLAHVVLPSGFHVTAINHPLTYLNKILLAAEDGRCLLLNLRTREIIHIFGPFPSSVTVLEASPVVDVVAVGTEDGSLYLHNFRHDETVVAFQQCESSMSLVDPDRRNGQVSPAVRAISFRSDGNETVVSADASGHLFVWDLNEKRLCSEAGSVHPNGVTFAEFLPGEPLLVTAGCADNAVKVHIFDKAEDNPRILRSREGHYLPPTFVRFCGVNGLSMVSAGLDRELRLVSVVRSARNRPFSQSDWDSRGKSAKKRQRRDKNTEIGDNPVELKRLLPPVVGIASRNAREKDSAFANIVTIHEGMTEACSWRFENGSSHPLLLRPPRCPRPTSLKLAYSRSNREPKFKRKNLARRQQQSSVSTASSVILSPCGHYTILGMSDGTIHSFNLQSGRHQGVYTDGEKVTGSMNESMAHMGSTSWGIAHRGPVACVCVDGCGNLLASVGTRDKTIKFWNLHNREAVGEYVHVPQNVLKMVWCESSDLLALATEDFSILLYDVPTRRLARHFKGHEATIVDMCFDTRGRRIFSASIDGSIRTWDLPSGCMVDVLRCTQAPTSVAVSPRGDYLATTHANCLSIRLWLDTTKFGREHVRNERDTHLIEYMSEDEETTLSEELIGDKKYSDVKETNATVVPLTDDIITLSGRPVTVWTVLSHLREFSDRSKPVQAPKKGENAPFFLPTVKGLGLKFDTSSPHGNKLDEEDGAQGKLTTPGWSSDEGYGHVSEFGLLMVHENFEEAGRILKQGSATQVDRHLRGLSGTHCLRNASKFFIRCLRERSSFELTQAHLDVFLNSHGHAISEDSDGPQLLKELYDEQIAAWRILRGHLDSVACLTSFLAGQV